jgi:transmembrane sensor
VRWLPKSRGRIRREAADWVVRLSEGADEETLRAFERWRDADIRHGEAHARLKGIWDEAARLAPAPATEAVQSPWSRERRIGMALAASLVGAAMLAASLFLAHRWRAEAPAAAEPVRFVTAIGEIREIALPDGSSIILDSASRVTGHFSPSERRLVLQAGRARFGVAREYRPFIVAAGRSEIVATGTLFDVSLVARGIDVLLLEGGVDVRSGGSQGGISQRLVPGEKLSMREGARLERAQGPRGENLWPWRMLVFKDTPIAEVVATANRYSRVRIALGESPVRDLRVSGAYRAGDTGTLARSLAAAFDLNLENRPDGTLVLSVRDAKVRR